MEQKASILFILFITLNSCIRKECDFPGSHVFEIPATLSPALETFRIGDTITINSTFEDMVFEKRLNNHYKLENWKFAPSTSIVKIDTLGTLSRIFDHFEILIDTQYQYHVQFFSGGDQILVGEYNYYENKYELQFKLVPQQEGLYFMKHGVDLFFIKNQTFEGQCKGNNIMDGDVKMNSGVDNNIQLLSLSPDPHFNTWILEKPDRRFHRFGGYCFRVVP